MGLVVRVSHLAALILVVTLAGCAGQGVATSGAASGRGGASTVPAATAGNASPLSPGMTRYTDPQLGFQLDALAGWSAQTYRGYDGAGAFPAASSVVLIDTTTREDVIQVSVLSSSAMPAAFARRGAPGARVGPYPAFTLDTSLSGGRVPCLVRVFLATDDYVIATLCAMNAPVRSAAFEQTLATYRPAAMPITSQAAPAAAPSDCAQAWSTERAAPLPAGWGQTLAGPANAGWRQLGSGVAVCSNTHSTDPYFYQCTELINRFLLERRGLAHIPGNAARYFDYALNGVVFPGRVREFPAGVYALSPDASQGASAFAPAPGDLLIFQDVADPQVGWRSGLINSPGHVALITGVDATRVYVAQENYSDSAYFQALPLRHVANGYAITDLSGEPNRIVRGWIRLGA
ncbi:MAG: hypothetical protein ACXVCO_07265 [Ktedonobacterales bacterium]